MCHVWRHKNTSKIHFFFRCFLSHFSFHPSFLNVFLWRHTWHFPVLQIIILISSKTFPLNRVPFHNQSYSITKNVRLSVCKKHIGRNVVITAAIYVRRLIIFVKVSYTEHSVYNLLGPSVCRSCYKRPIYIMSKKFRDFLHSMYIFITLNICSITHFVHWSIHNSFTSLPMFFLIFIL